MARRRGLLCTSISAPTCEEMGRKAGLAFALGSDLVEFRIDSLADPSFESVRELSPFLRRAVLTVRARSEGGAFRGGEAERGRLIADLAKLRPAYVDVELLALRERRELASLPPAKRIVSWHSLSSTPPRSELRKVLGEARRFGGTVKIVTLARSVEDNLEVLSLYRGGPEDLVAFCMGDEGVVSRVLALRLGTPLMFASLPGEQVAPGQVSISAMRQLRRLA